MMLHIRNMESGRCITMVKDELHKLGLHCKSVELGKVELREDLSLEKMQLIDNVLKNSGLELIDDKKSVLIENIKKVVYQLIYLSDDLPKPNFPEIISRNVKRDYTYLSNLFSSVQGITIEKYILQSKIERVKELLVYNKLSLSDIADKLHYSSVAHLSNQFKKLTGLKPSFFRELRNISLRNG
jgi:AraC-like DNA-binding protein